MSYSEEDREWCTKAIYRLTSYLHWGDYEDLVKAQDAIENIHGEYDETRGRFVYRAECERTRMVIQNLRSSVEFRYSVDSTREEDKSRNRYLRKLIYVYCLDHTLEIDGQNPETCLNKIYKVPRNKTFKIDQHVREIHTFQYHSVHELHAEVKIRRS